MTVVISKRAWSVVYICLLIAGVSLTTAGFAIRSQQKTSNLNTAAILANRALVDQNKVLITQLQVQASVAAHDAAEALRRDTAEQQFALALQRQVQSLGGTPLPVPPALRASPAVSPSTDASGPRPTPSLTAAPRPTATASPQPTRSRGPSSPSPTVSATCSLQRPLKCLR